MPASSWQWLRLFLAQTFIDEFVSYYHQVKPNLKNKDIKSTYYHSATWYSYL